MIVTWKDLVEGNITGKSNTQVELVAHMEEHFYEMQLALFIISMAMVSWRVYKIPRDMQPELIMDWTSNVSSATSWES